MKIQMQENNVIKVTLNKEESEQLHIDYKQFNYNKETTQKAFEIIMYKIMVKLKKKIPKEKAIINAYPYIDSGILIYVMPQE